MYITPVILDRFMLTLFLVFPCHFFIYQDSKEFDFADSNNFVIVNSHIDIKINSPVIKHHISFIVFFHKFHIKFTVD